MCYVFAAGILLCWCVSVSHSEIWQSSGFYWSCLQIESSCKGCKYAVVVMTVCHTGNVSKWINVLNKSFSHTMELADPPGSVCWIVHWSLLLETTFHKYHLMVIFLIMQKLQCANCLINCDYNNGDWSCLMCVHVKFFVTSKFRVLTPQKFLLLWFNLPFVI